MGAMSRMLAEQAKERDTITKALALEPASAPLDMVPELKLRSNYATIMQVGVARPRVCACVHACVLAVWVYRARVKTHAGEHATCACMRLLMPLACLLCPLCTIGATGGTVEAAPG